MKPETGEQWTFVTTYELCKEFLTLMPKNVHKNKEVLSNHCRYLETFVGAKKTIQYVSVSLKCAQCIKISKCIVSPK